MVFRAVFIISVATMVTAPAECSVSGTAKGGVDATNVKLGRLECVHRYTPFPDISGNRGPIAESKHLAQSSAQPERIAQAAPRKLQKATFAEDHFCVMLPPGYETKVQTANEQRVAIYTVEDYPHGTYEITCNTAPPHSAFSPLLLKKTIDSRKDIKKVDGSQPIQIGEFTGTAWDVTLQTPSPHDSGKIIGVITGPRMYVLTASGTKPWLESAGVKQFLQSFELIPD